MWFNFLAQCFCTKSGFGLAPLFPRPTAATAAAVVESWAPFDLPYNPHYLVCFCSRNSIFLSQQFSQNSVFQTILAKFQQAEQGLKVMLKNVSKSENKKNLCFNWSSMQGYSYQMKYHFHI